MQAKRYLQNTGVAALSRPVRDATACLQRFDLGEERSVREMPIGYQQNMRLCKVYALPD